MELLGDERAVGTKRNDLINKTVETQVYREVGEERKSYSYTIAPPEDGGWNPFGVVGYVATVTVWALTGDDAGRSLVEWKAHWESAKASNRPNTADSSGAFNPTYYIGKSLHYAIDVLTGKREPKKEHAADMPRMMPKAKL